MKRALVASLTVVVLGGLWLRFVGLSHDLSAGYVYHPDTPKQIRATQRFLAGIYSYRYDHPDYDGYPYFDSHLVEYMVRAYQLGANATLALIGASPLGSPDPLTLYWITRVLSAVLSTLSILVAFALGRRAFGAGAGLIAALFLALSPADVAAAHYETSDPAAAFFALLSVYFALRIYDRGRRLDSALAGVFATCGFAAKYHAGIAIVPAVLAHFLRAAGGKELGSRRLLGGLALLTVAAIGTLFVTIPTLLTEPVQTVRDILGFLRHTSTVNVPAPLQGAFHDRFLFSLRRNTPVLADIVGPQLLAIAVVGVVLPIGDWRRRVIVASLPVLYFLVVIPFRPKAHAVYHTLMTPLVFLIAAAALASLPVTFSARVARIWRVASVAFILVSAGCLFRYSLREDFFFTRQDTRRMARQWTEENVPSSFRIKGSGYGFTREPSTSPIEKPGGRLVLSTNLRPLAPPPDAFLLKRFHLEESPLPVFRNPTIEMFLETSALARDFRVPVFPTLPAKSGNDFIFEGGPDFYRREQDLLLEAGGRIDKTLVTHEPLCEALFVIQGGELPTTVSLSFGNVRRDVRLGPAESRWVSVEGMEKSFASGEGTDLYRLRVRTSFAPVRITLATSPLERGLALYAHRFYGEAYPWLARAASADRDPEIAALGVISRELSGLTVNEAERASLDEIAEHVADLADERVLNERYHGIVEYLDALEYDFHEAETLPTEGFRIVADEDASSGRAIRPETGSEDAERSLSIPLGMLEPGRYAVKARLRLPRGAPEGRLSIRLADSAGIERYRKESDCCSPDASRFTIRRFEFEIPFFEPSWQLSIVFDRVPAVVDTVEIAPDLAGQARAIEQLRRLSITRDPLVATGELGAYEPMRILADRLAAGAETDRAVALYRAASELRPDQAPPLEALARLGDSLSAEQSREIAPRLAVLTETKESRVLHAAAAEFEGDLHLDGYRIRGLDVRRGGSLGLDLYWNVLAKEPPRYPINVWVHFLDDSGHIVFQGDHELLDDLRRIRHASELRPTFYEIPIPESAPPGSYGVAVGLYHVQAKRKVRLLASAGAGRDGGVLLPLRVQVR